MWSCELRGRRGGRAVTRALPCRVPDAEVDVGLGEIDDTRALGFSHTCILFPSGRIDPGRRISVELQKLATSGVGDGHGDSTDRGGPRRACRPGRAGDR